ncbi:MAG: geranylgeranylglyceryl/heptaprenylglyceryl phosphate synthase [Candidatus Aenigmarchaeota archaeon]|nr:geranylgeranylglyceryl/heptaprenylglyceryl phosphate synthase [Candidatus Aenigmarchaeota archaeon]
MSGILNWINRETKKGTLHFTLIDPEKPDNLKQKAKELKLMGSDAFLVGGSTNIRKNVLDKTVKILKKTSMPVILYPGDINGVTKYADAILFMSLMNSKNPYWITGAQAKSSISVKQSKLEPLSMGYIIVEPGGAAGRVGEAELIKRTDSKKAIGYALAAQYMGMSLVYLEAGSGAATPIPVNMVKKVKKAVSIPLIVGGGIRDAAAAKAATKAGADIIVTGNVTEDNFDAIKGIITAIKNVKR